MIFAICAPIMIYVSMCMAYHIVSHVIYEKDLTLKNSVICVEK